MRYRGIAIGKEERRKGGGKDKGEMVYVRDKNSTRENEREIHRKAMKRKGKEG